MNLTELKSFKDLHKGQPGHVCGCGTSLNDTQKKLDGIVICVNSAGIYFDSYDYLVITDGSNPHMQYWYEVIDKAKTIIVANPSCLGGEADALSRTKTVHVIDRRYDDRDNMRFEDDKLVMGHDVIHVAAHFAWVLGLRPITLHGVDLCYAGTGQRYFDNSAYQYKDNRGSQHIDKIKELDNDSDLSSSISPWQQIIDQNPGITEIIFNASKISQVPGITKV